jgi:hypothetical protein
MRKCRRNSFETAAACAAVSRARCRVARQKLEALHPAIATIRIVTIQWKCTGQMQQAGFKPLFRSLSPRRALCAAGTDTIGYRRPQGSGQRRQSPVRKVIQHERAKTEGQKPPGGRSTGSRNRA